jgi:flagellar biosynthesis protein FliQ
MIAIFAAVTLGAPLMAGQLGNLAVLVFSHIETGF